MDSSMQSLTQSLQGQQYQDFMHYRNIRTSKMVPLQKQYEILGFISSGTYGNVFKAKKGQKIYAIKKFKPDKEGDAALASGISQSACREIGLCRELQHENIVYLEQVIMEAPDRSIAMVFEYADHDLLQILHFHAQQERKAIPEYTIKSFLWQLLNGVAYLHANWVLHRDLKPANILVTSDGIIKIGDLGLARQFQAPLQPLIVGDKVVVTIWYRAPELLLGSHHYTKAIDVWATGCIYGELLMLKPMFKGDEVKMDSKKPMPFQKDQFTKMIDTLGFPTKDRWSGIGMMPDYHRLKELNQTRQNNLRAWFQQIPSTKTEGAYNLLSAMLEYDPNKRITADDALSHPYFNEQPKPGVNAFVYPVSKKQMFQYPTRRLQDEKKIKK